MLKPSVPFVTERDERGNPTKWEQLRTPSWINEATRFTIIATPKGNAEPYTIQIVAETLTHAHKRARYLLGPEVVYTIPKQED